MTGSMHGWFAHSPVIAPLLIEQAVNVRQGHCIGCWAHNDAPGSLTVRDYSGRGHHGTPHAVTFGQPGRGGLTAGAFDGSTSYVDVFSASLAGAFSLAEGSLLVWFRVAEASVWLDSEWRRLLHLKADPDNMLHLYRRGGEDRKLSFSHTGGGYTRTATYEFPGTPVSWQCLVATWKEGASGPEDHLYLYVNGNEEAHLTYLGTSVGALTEALVGSNGSLYWNGDLGLVSLYDVVLTVGEAARLARRPL